jgi:hypothetical protein
MKRCRQMFSVLAVAGGLVLAGDPFWKSKPISNWTDEDLRQILTDSPWAKTVKASVTRLQSEDERREGGNMGQEHGVGYDGVDGKRTRPKLPSSIIRGPNDTRAPATITLTLRWESALPIRVAEAKARVIEPPTLPGDGYSLAVYGVPGANFKGDPKSLGDPLKKQAVLKREGKKDVKPLSVEVFQREDGFVIVYLFSLSAEITDKDAHLDFSAQIGRIVIAHSFDVAAMRFQGKLEI